MKLIVDMNLSPSWVEYLRNHGIDADHWSALGNVKAPDREIMNYARERAFVVFTHDLDFGNILAVTHALGPSVIQIRTQDPVPEAAGILLIAAITEHGALLQRGALLTVEPHKSRVRVLPIVPGNRKS